MSDSRNSGQVLGTRVKLLLFLYILLLVCPLLLYNEDTDFHPQPHRFISKLPVPQTDSSACYCSLHASFPGLWFHIWLYWDVCLLIFVHIFIIYQAIQLILYCWSSIFNYYSPTLYFLSVMFLCLLFFFPESLIEIWSSREQTLGDCTCTSC